MTELKRETKYFTHKGYHGTVEWPTDEDPNFFGKMVLDHDIVTYEASTIFELKKEFMLAVEDYIDMKERLEGKE